ncbi:sulfatase-like hydrolase/transferase [Tundrisphaera lichenicola]|uniref:sulfatase-like hydrolase/transferase n=1 Tax=Tundrisphaera lichenicola TaxID=2029860 RepID=UPI003EBB6304
MSLISMLPMATVEGQDRPNILWLTSEDHGTQMGCYGDRYANTPHVDRLAARGMIYSHAWSNAPVCAPARSTLISGMYAPSTGAEHMRSLVPYPSGLKMFPQLLREAGYYCTNNAKEDYNLAKPGRVWDASSKSAHWRNRPSGRPFFAVFNSEKSHESKIRTPPPIPGHDPAGVRVPAYHPDTPEVRADWARYHDGVTDADADAGRRLAELERDGLVDDTIVFYFGDHGSGMPRSKRWPYDSGLRVPLVVAIPEKWRHLAPEGYTPGGRSDRLVSFVDFGPTVLSLAGVRPPAWLQGHAFLGEFAAPPQPFLYGFRGRMDERRDLVRSVTDGNLVYIRNYMPHLIYGQHIDYMFQTRTTQVWKALHDQGKLTPAQDAFWNPKPPEELYNLRDDPDEVHNLVDAPEHRESLDRLRQAHRDHARGILDVGFLPEGDRFRRSQGASPYDLAREPGRYPFDRIFATASEASMTGLDALPDLKSKLVDDDPAVRYWAALGILIRGKAGFESAGKELAKALDDPSPEVQVVAAQALGTHGSEEDRSRAIANLLSLADWSKNDVFTSMTALAAIDDLGPRAGSLAKSIRALPAKGPAPDPRYASYVPRLLQDLSGR